MNRLLIGVLLLPLLSACDTGSGLDSNFLDLSFGVQGVTTTDLNGRDNHAMDVAIQDDGRIVVVGYSLAGQEEELFVARYDATGNLDSGFGSDNNGVGVPGVRSGGISFENDRAYSVAIQQNGKIVVAGVVTNGLDTNVLLVRYLSNGEFDTGFGTNGIVVMDVGNELNSALAVELQADGKIVLSGNSGENLLVIRFQIDGSLDAGFANNGVALVYVPRTNTIAHPSGSQLVFDAGGNAIIAGVGTELGFSGGASRSDIFVTKLDAAGQVDTNFADSGYIFAVTAESDSVGDLLLTADNNILVSSTVHLNGIGPRMLLYQYSLNGTANKSFSEVLASHSDYAPSNDIGGDMTLTENQSVLIASYTASTNTDRL